MKVVVRLSASCTSRPYPQEMFLVLIFTICKKYRRETERGQRKLNIEKIQRQWSSKINLQATQEDSIDMF
jgi:hypothetical protein